MVEIYNEIGTPGIQSFLGYVNQAYIRELEWPGCFSIYNKLRRSDPEVTISRQAFTAMARGQRIEFALPDDPSDDDKRFQEFGAQVLDDVEGGQSQLLDNIVSYTPFMGWLWLEAVPGLRKPDWTPPDPEDPWRSEYDDGLIGFRRFALRDHSSFDRWELSQTGRMSGMWQNDFPNPRVLLPLDQSIHLTFGDPTNPEGLSPLESLYRLERFKYALEMILGMGYEHAAGYLDVKSDKDLSTEDKNLIRQVARALMSAQEGNYAAWPSHLTGELKDIPFAAGTSLLTAIQYFHAVKLMLFNMQWAALSATTGAGSYSAMSDSSGMFVMTYNAMMKGFTNQLDAQLGRRLYKLNKDKFPGITKRPRLVITSAEKTMSVAEIAQLITAMGVDQLSDEDWIAIRKATKILPETLPDKEPAPAQPKNTDSIGAIEQDAQDQADADEQAVQAAIMGLAELAKEHRPELAELLEREVE